MTNGKLMLLSGMLFLLMALKFALGQNGSDMVGWDPQPYQDPLDCVFGVMIGAPVLGTVFGALRIVANRLDLQRPVLEPIRLN